MQYHIQCESVSPYVLLPGDPGRVEQIAEHIGQCRKVAQNREYTTFTGIADEVPITITSTGIGAPSTAIAIEELRRCGGHTFVRVGTCGARHPSLDVGDLVIATGAIRSEGTSKSYAPLEYPAVASYDVVLALIESCHRLGYPCHEGLFETTDALYAGAPGAGRGAIVADMESSVIFILSQLYGLRGGSLCLVVNRDSEGVKLGEPFTYGPEQMERLCRAAVTGIKILHRWDKERGKERLWCPSLSHR